ncbi:response regulator [Dongia deserti]|uniref:response regulator n=1 Tax=Dongia deserti TaxID=2268030 RepID=UPI000E65CBC5|nr:response regulator [Dongia deserti]
MAMALVIDDDPQVRCLIAMMLKRAGYEVAQAKDGGEGIELCASLEPEVIVTDIFMPHVDGIDVLREAKVGSRQPRVVAISGGSPRLPVDYLNVAQTLGADAVVQKPFTPSQLLQAVTGNPEHIFA